MTPKEVGSSCRQACTSLHSSAVVVRRLQTARIGVSVSEALLAVSAAEKKLDIWDKDAGGAAYGCYRCLARGCRARSRFWLVYLLLNRNCPAAIVPAGNDKTEGRACSRIFLLWSCFCTAVSASIILQLSKVVHCHRVFGLVHLVASNAPVWHLFMGCMTASCDCAAAKLHQVWLAKLAAALGCSQGAVG